MQSDSKVLDTTNSVRVKKMYKFGKLRSFSGDNSSRR